MSVNSYVECIATSGILRDEVRDGIERSLGFLQSKLDSYFSNGSQLKGHFTFGSFSRGTSLPRDVDPESDVDYMIVFGDSDSRPQAYLDRLKHFVEASYPASEITQSHPTIVLSLNHIRFELVPAIQTFWSGLQIPAKSSEYSEWVSSSPIDFNKKLTEKNTAHQNLIKPLIRALKYWNSCNAHPFESFALETFVVDQWTPSHYVFGASLWQRFRSFIEDLNQDAAATDRQRCVIRRAQVIVAAVRSLESSGYPDEATRLLREVLPDIIPSE